MSRASGRVTSRKHTKPHNLADADRLTHRTNAADKVARTQTHMPTAPDKARWDSVARNRA